MDPRRGRLVLEIDPGETVIDGRGSAFCRFCGAPLTRVLVDLGASPPCERFLAAADLDSPEPTYPLRAMVCETCWLVQVGEFVPPTDIFTDYAYFSSYSTSWLEHARRYATRMTAELGLDGDRLVVEVGSNDGYLLRHFRDLGVRVLGVDPAANVAAVAIAAGIPTEVTFFGRTAAEEIARTHGQADLIAGNNVLAQVPDVNDFVAGIARLLAPAGTVTIEFPHLLRLIEENQFDTIYHEHFSYFTLRTVGRIFAAHGMAVVDVDELPTHGGSLRIHARHRLGAGDPSAAVARVLADEERAGLERGETYDAFASRVARLRQDVLSFLIAERRAGRRVIGYGAPGKANTLLNYCGIRSDLLEFTVDRNPYKHGRFTPGMRIPIREPDRLLAARPDIIWILPWNLRDEIAAQLAEDAAAIGARFMTAIPHLDVWAPGGGSDGAPA
jgi:SAM-dependent methyltransferase